MKSFIYRYILYLTVVPFISCNSDLRIEGTYDFADSNDPMKASLSPKRIKQDLFPSIT